MQLGNSWNLKKPDCSKESSIDNSNRSTIVDHEIAIIDHHMFISRDFDLLGHATMFLLAIYQICNWHGSLLHGRLHKAEPQPVVLS